MEDYTYHLARTAASCLARTCSRSARRSPKAKPSLEIHPLSIGGKEDPVRLVFDTPAGPALNASLIDLGNRFRLLVNEVTAVNHPAAAETSGRPRGLGVQARLQDGLRGLDPRGRRASHRL